MPFLKVGSCANTVRGKRKRENPKFFINLILTNLGYIISR